MAHYIQVGEGNKVGELKRRLRDVYLASRDEFREVSFSFGVPMEMVDSFLQLYKALELADCLELIASDFKLLVHAEAVENKTSEFKESSPFLFGISQFMIDRDRKVFEGKF
ncbi:MAG: hypothetical protein NTW27_10955 [Deltaproteobacteria bacterium]|nr:hypothetical protein [Deltaproteobacteria bacterium]